MLIVYYIHLHYHQVCIRVNGKAVKAIGDEARFRSQ